MQWFQKLARRAVQMRMHQLLVNKDIHPDYDGMSLKLPQSEEPLLAKRILAELTLEEKISLLSGIDEFCIPGVERIGLKPVWTSDASIGLRGWNAPVTDFPAAVGLAASFNTLLLKKVGKTIAQECRAIGVGVLLGPGVNIARVPVCGRNFEYFGEDPYLAGEMAASYIQGFKDYPVITTVKHFACNNSEYDRHKSNSVVDERTLREIYLPAFKRALDAGTLGLMTSYNQVNGTYASEHPYLLDGILRGEWGFDGLVVSDWNSLYSTEGVLSSGVDVEMPEGKYLSQQRVQEALQQGLCSEQDINDKVFHLLTSYEKAGVLTQPLADKQFEIGSTEHRNVALEAGIESLVLLKNENMALPLNTSMKLCIGGSNAWKVVQGGGSSMIEIEPKPECFAQTFDEETTKLPTRWYHSKQYRQKVSSCDAVVLVVGFSHFEESEAYDRPWKLDKATLKSIRIASLLNKRTIIVVQSGGAVELASFDQKVSAILWAPYLGSSTAQALRTVLFGETSPSGKLPFTIASCLSDYRSMRNYPKDFDHISPARIQKGQGDPLVRPVSPISYTENLMVGYRQFDTENLEPRYCFGHGLSYSQFSYSDMQIGNKQDNGYLVSFNITNIGSCEASEVVQLYIQPLEPLIFRARQELKGFHKVILKAGESKRIEMELSESAFGRWDLGKWEFVSDPGSYEICLGSSSRDIRLKEVISYPN